MSSAEFDLNSLAKKGLQQKLSDIEREYKEKSPIIRTAVDESKRLMKISITNKVPDTKAILEDMVDMRETILCTHNNKIKEIDSIIAAIDAEIIEVNGEILQIKVVIEALEKIEKENSVIDESDMLAIQSAVKTLTEVEDGSSTDKSENLTIKDCIEHMRCCENEAIKKLECFEESKKKALSRKSGFNTFTQELIQKLDGMKDEHLKNSYSMITDTIKTGEKNIERGEKSLKTLERRYHAVLKYRRLCYLKQDSSPLPHTSAPTPR